MKSRVLGIDASIAGLSGDMILAGLVSLEPKLEEILNRVVHSIQRKTGSKDFSAILSIINHDWFDAIQIEIKNNQSINTNEMVSFLGDLVREHKLHQPYDSIANDAVNFLVMGEKQVHSTDHPKLHELGSIDTIFDIITFCVLAQYLDIEYLSLSPIATGQGIVDTSHGILPVPAPVTMLILEQHQILTVPGPLGGEALTPTGISLIAACKKHLKNCEDVIVMWQSHGYGLGHKKWADRANVLRVKLGSIAETKSRIDLLETNIDDATGEILGHAMERLMAEGALDVSYMPIFMKKNRPAYCLRVLVKSASTEKFTNLISSLTGSLGIRITSINRHVEHRKSKLINGKLRGKDIQFSIKISDMGMKIEYEDLVQLAKEFNVPIRKMEWQLLQMVDLDMLGDGFNEP